MTDASPDYDDVPGRTRQAWLRTNLGVVAVSLLVLRGLLLAGHGGWPALLVLLPAIAFTGVCVWRSIHLHASVDTASHRTAAVLGVAAVLALAATGITVVMFG